MEGVNGEISCNMFSTESVPFGETGDCFKTSGLEPVETSGLDPGGDGSMIS